MTNYSPAYVLTAILAFVLLAVWQNWREMKRADFIRSHPLPVGLFEKLRAKHPNLQQKECQLVAHALRAFFLAHLKSGRKYVSMPSQVADDLWHEFILYTKEYAEFCNKAFGRFMHHVPAAVLGGSAASNAGLRRCWWYACKEENINPAKATRLPLLFALDAKLDIPGGFRYIADCAGFRERAGEGGVVIHCGGDFSSSSFDGGTDGFGDGDGGGGGDGCGGGCGGGGD